jgi:ribosomal protein L11 methyltransferase
VLELTLRVAAAEVEEALDALLPALPGGVHVRSADGEVAIAVLATPGTPSEEELRRLIGPWLIELSANEVSDEWRQRRLARYEPLVIAGRFLIRPEWAPRGEDPDLIEIALEQAAAFGTGLHPTTQACLATLAGVEPGGAFADLGCGSGVLSIAAARLGFSSVVAIDVDVGSVAATARNAKRNGVELEARRVDLRQEPAPVAESIVANVPPDIQRALTGNLREPPRQAIVSGFGPEESAAVAAGWEAHGLRIADEVRANEWVVLVMR